MKYILFCLHNKEIDKYQKSIVNKIYNEFNLKMTKEENIFAHFTLKYSFDANSKQLTELKKIISEFSKKHTKQKISIGGFDNFHKKVIFIKLNQNPKIKKTIFELHKELKKLNWMPWCDFDITEIHLHTTVAEESTEKIYPKIKEFISGKEKYFDTDLDNISIMKYSTAKKPKRRWVLEKRYDLV